MAPLHRNMTIVNSTVDLGEDGVKYTVSGSNCNITFSGSNTVVHLTGSNNVVRVTGRNITFFYQRNANNQVTISGTNCTTPIDTTATHERGLFKRIGDAIFGRAQAQAAPPNLQPSTSSTLQTNSSAAGTGTSKSPQKRAGNQTATPPPAAKKARVESAQDILKVKEEARQNLPLEPERAGGDDGTFILRFRVNNDFSFQRNFRRTDTLQVLIQTVLSRPEAPYPFHIVRRPNQYFPMSPPEIDLTLGELGFGASELLFITKWEPSVPDVTSQDGDISAQE